MLEYDTSSFNLVLWPALRKATGYRLGVGLGGPGLTMQPADYVHMYTILQAELLQYCLYLNEGSHQLEVPRPETPCLVQREVFEIGDQDDPVHLGLFALDQVLQR